MGGRGRQQGKREREEKIRKDGGSRKDNKLVRTRPLCKNFRKGKRMKKEDRGFGVRQGCMVVGFHRKWSTKTLN